MITEQAILRDVDTDFVAGGNLWNIYVGLDGATSVSNFDDTVVSIDQSPAVAIANLLGQYESRRVVSELTSPRVVIDNIDSVDRFPDLRGLVDAIHHETGTLLQAKLESMEDSFAERNAVVLMDGDRAVGYARFTELLNAEKKLQLGLPDDFPDISEIGTAIIDPEYRGRHLYSRLRNGLLSLRAQEMREKRLLGLGTSKNGKVLKTLSHASEIGLRSTVTDFSLIPMVSAFTCGCTGDFGNGVQNGPECFSRSTSSEVVLIQQADYKSLQAQVGGMESKIPCTLYVSDLELAQSMDVQLAQIFGTQANLASAIYGGKTE